jgi:glycosyltransferase involved in cell wall biosynthesis
MKICLVTTFPPSGRQLNEYAFHIASEIQRNPQVRLSILGDELTSYEFATDENGEPIGKGMQTELPGFDVIRCWKFNDPANPFRILSAVRAQQPDVVWFNLVFSTFATQDHPIAAFAGLCSPALMRANGFYTHVTLHHILEHVDFAGAGVRREKLFRLSGDVATRILLRANSVSVLLSGYQQTLREKYSVQNVLLGTHGIFARCPSPPNFSKRGNPHRILAIGHWGTYKRLETLMAAFPDILEKHPHARLVIAGANHHNRAGYWESIRELHGKNPNIEFRGYVSENEIPELFRAASVLVMPYDSATGSSGPAHQACEFGVPIVSADIPDFRVMAADEDMAVSFYKIGDADDLAGKITAILDSPSQQSRMAEQNFCAALRMTMPRVVRHYLRWFELERHMRIMSVGEVMAFKRWRRRQVRSSVSSRAAALRRMIFSSNPSVERQIERKDIPVIVEEEPAEFSAD